MDRWRTPLSYSAINKGCEVDAALELKRKSNIDFTTCPLTYTHKKAQVNQGLEQGRAVARRLRVIRGRSKRGGGELWGPDMRRFIPI